MLCFAQDKFAWWNPSIRRRSVVVRGGASKHGARWSDNVRRPDTTTAAADYCWFIVVVVLVVVDLYSASLSASNALNVPLHHKKMSFQRRFEAAGTPSRVPEWVLKRVPFHWTLNRESLTNKRAATVLWNHQLVTVGRSKALVCLSLVRCQKLRMRAWVNRV